MNKQLATMGQNQSIADTAQSVWKQSFAIGQNRCTSTAQGERFVAYEHQSGSDDGRFELQVEAWEARNSHWVFAPRLRYTSSDKFLFKPEATTWSADSSTWNGAQVRIVLRSIRVSQ